MHPITGDLFSEAQMKDMTEAERKSLVRIEGSPADVERISEAVKRLNRAERRAANRKAGLLSNGQPKPRAALPRDGAS